MNFVPVDFLLFTCEGVHFCISDHLDKTFIRFILDTIESPLTPEHEDQVTDLLVNFILAFDLHFHKVGENLVMKEIAERKTVKVLTEKILLLFNRDGEFLLLYINHHISTF